MSIIPVPGSERFASRRRSREEVAREIDPALAIFDIHGLAPAELDPLSYEVIRHRLWSITDMMGESLKRMSGSLAVTDSNDFDIAIADPYGETVQVGPYNTQLVASIGFGIQWILANRASNPGIGEGDMFLCNDPWIGGGLHQNDVSLFAPIFFEGKLFGWTVAVAHQLDLGGVAPGSWTPRAQDVFWESLPTPPVRIVHKGVLQKDIEDVYLRRSRTPQMVGLDLRAKMGANLVGQERIAALIDRYGAGVVQAVMQRQMDDAERQLRAKLLGCPDGEWTAESYQEQSMQGDRGLHAIRCQMTKKGSDLTFDFTDTDEQSGMINTTFCGLAGGIVAGIIPMLCGNIPWSIGGLMRCISIKSKPGTLNDATFPAAVGKGSVASTWATTNTVMECLGKMLDCSVEHKHDAMGVCCGTWDLSVFAGLDQHGAPFANILFDPMGGGFGAGADHDGIDTGGLPIIPQGRMPDVEMNEFTMPLLYLWRREETDSGGPGAYRGGLAGSLAVVPHRTAVPMAHVVSGSGKAVPMNVGIAGGYPGNTQRDITIRNSKVASLLGTGALPQTIEEIEVRSCEEEGFLHPGDAHYMFWQAGGGYGDPLRAILKLSGTTSRPSASRSRRRAPSTE